MMSVEPKRPLLPVTAYKSEGAPSMGFIVTRGFRNILDNAVGTCEINGNWETSDDLVWAYAHGFKEDGARSGDQAARLYATEDDMRHYSTPWRYFLNGEEFFQTMAQQLVARMKENPRWDKSDVALLENSDRWDTGPQVGSMHSWQDFEGFNDHLKQQGEPGLSARTLQGLSAEGRREIFARVGCLAPRAVRR